MIQKITDNSTKTMNRMVNQLNSDIAYKDSANAILANVLNYQAALMYNQLSALDVKYTAQFRDIYNDIDELRKTIEELVANETSA